MNSKYTEESAINKLKASCQIKVASKLILPNRSLGLRLLGAVDYLKNYCGYIFAPLR